MKAKVYLIILRLGVLLSLLTVFLVFNNLLFPYITSKQLVFNILTEFLLVFYLLFLAKFPAYRPKKSYITWGLVAYFVAILISLLVTVDFNLSFWGDAERMLGIFHLLHFLILYFIIITVFRTWKDWKLLFLASILIASLESYLGLRSALNYGTIGNTAYVSGYLIFNLFFSALLFLKENKKWLRWLYLLPVAIMLLEFRRADTSGAIIGLGTSILLFLFLFGFFNRNRKIKYSSLGVLVVLIIATIFLFSQSSAAWFKSNKFLYNLTVNKATFQTRLISWKGAARDFKYHPILGVGYGNYATIFDRQFDPKFFNYSRTETYFDRAHNNLIDIASTTGALGLLAYLSIFVALFYYLFIFAKPLLKKYRAGEEEAGVKLAEIFILIALVAAYFIQNLAVFDSLVTYIGLMIILAYANWLFNTKEVPATIEATSALKPKTEYISLALSLIIISIFTYTFNIRPWQMFVKTINSYSTILSGDVINGVAGYKEAFSANTPMDRDARFTFITLVTNNPNILAYMMPVEAKDFLDYVISLAERNLSYNPNDSLDQLQLAQVADLAARFNHQQDQATFNYYSTLSLQAIDTSIKASPRRLPLYFIKAHLFLVRGDADQAIESMKYGISLNSDYPDGYCQLSLIYFLLKDENSSYPYIDACLDKDGSFSFPADALGVWKKHYTATKDSVRLEKINQQLDQLNQSSLGQSTSGQSTQ
ncbi:MAG: O-antigen ligase family protein [Candidatus Falkowbacteria bacterium]|nr:O-antigen ligase family protein [Candidatus Falkowbacteria bacterium]